MNRHPAMAAQEYFWYLHESDPEPSSYALSIPLEIVGPLDGARLQRAVEDAINEREVFRAAFCEVDGRVFQVVDPGAPRFELELVDDTADVPRTVGELARQLDLATGALVRGRLQPLSPMRHILVLVLHHAVSDGRTLLMLVRDIFTRYRSGEAEPDVEHYFAYAAAFERFAASPEGRERRAWWQERVRDARAVALPFDAAREPSDAQRRAARFGIVAEPMHPMCSVEVPPPLRQELARVARAHKVPASIVYLAAHLRLLHEVAHQDDIFLETVYDACADGRAEPMFGPVATWTYMRFDLAAARTVADVLAVANRGFREAMEHSLIPDQFRTIPAELRGTCFNYVPITNPTSKLDDLTVTRLPSPFPPYKRHWHLMLFVVDSSRQGYVNWTGSERLWRRETIQGLARQYLAQLEALLGG